MSSRRERQLDPDSGANGWMLLAIAVLTIAVAAMIAWILIDNANQEATSAAAMLLAPVARRGRLAQLRRCRASAASAASCATASSR